MGFSMGDGRVMGLSDVRLSWATTQVCMQLLRQPGVTYSRLATRLGITHQAVSKHVAAACRKYPRLRTHLSRRRGRPSNRPLALGVGERLAA
jgi:DNA-binding MarR family transcriptional regulator